MSDLQCPATFHVAGPGVPADRIATLLGGAPVAAVYVGSVDARPTEPGSVYSRPPGDTGAFDTGAFGAFDIAAFDAAAEHLDETRALWEVLEELSDLHRGAHVVVRPTQVVPPLTGAGDAVTVRIDADGRSVERP